MFFFLLAVPAPGQPVDIERKAEIEAALREFFADPKAAMDRRIPKYDAQNGQRVVEFRDSRFTPEDIASGKHIEASDSTRARMCMELNGEKRCLGAQGGIPPLAVVRGEDRVENLIDVPLSMTTLEAIEENYVMGATLPIKPWSDDYWAFYKGVLGARYADDWFPASPNWAANRSYVQRQSVDSIVRSGVHPGNQWRIDRLAPSEKYDLLVGDAYGSLSQSMWQMGANYYYSMGFVETWMGICEGWAAASIMLPRPLEVKSVLAADGVTRLNFYPSDIKALASLLWAYGKFSLRFVGGRCEERNPARDYNGRIIRQECFDTNPATFHLALTHQLGLAKRGLVMDATYDYEVWNHPVYSYMYSYFNPQTGLATSTITDAKVPLRSFTRNPFRWYRSPSTASVVGVAMDVWYVFEMDASHTAVESWEADPYRRVRYFYDLELDAEGKIIGGEWYSNHHPDFLWVPPPGMRAVSGFESRVSGSWNMREPLPRSWRDAAVQASRYSQPLGAIVEALIR